MYGAGGVSIRSSHVFDLEVKSISKDLRVNEEIRAREVRLIGQDGQQLGIMSPREALKIAQEQGLDLVEVASTAKPPVCRFMDYGRYRYEQSKREKEARKRQKVINIKEVKLRLRIEEHDFQVKVRNALRFLQDGDKVKVTIMFRGRELSHADLGHKLCNKLTQEVKEIAVVEKPPSIEGRNMVMILGPRVSQNT
ncbi:MAG: translation initiation factor IF-3 [Clostridia bacterium]|nr:MAG: translation initiation factor IF-3 [Clostridia bacterium]